MPQILIVGPGAIGGALAARWVEAGREVLLLARNLAEETALERRGLLFTGTSGKKRLIRRGVLSARRGAKGPVSAAFFCVKSGDTAAAIAAARRWIGPETAVVTLQNGVGHDKLLRRAFGRRRVVIGVCYVAADRAGAREIVHNGGKDVKLALTAGRENAEAAKIAADLLKPAGWHVAVEPDEDAVLWTKLCFNAAGNPLAAVCSAANGELVRDPALRALLVRALDEALAAAKAEGHHISPVQMRRLVLKTYPADSRQRNSMLQDLAAGRRTEIDAIAGPVIAAGKRNRVPTPLLSRLAGLVKTLERLP